jgi:hypothetical protein
MAKDKDITSDEVTKADATDYTPTGIAAGVVPDAWSETALVAISPVGYGELLFETLSESIDLDDGEKPVEWVPNLAGGRITKFGPKEDTTLTLELYPILSHNKAWPAASATAIADGVYDLMEGATTINLDINSVRRNKIRCTILWSDNTALTNATVALPTTTTADRVVYAEGYITQIKREYSTDELQKTTVTMKFPATDKLAKECQRLQSKKAGDNEIAALGAYTNSTKF